MTNETKARTDKRDQRTNMALYNTQWHRNRNRGRMKPKREEEEFGRERNRRGGEVLLVASGPCDLEIAACRIRLVPL